MKYIFLFAPVVAGAATFQCDTTSATHFDEKLKITVSNERSSYIQKRKAYVIVEDEANPSVRRCSFAPSKGQVTCDRYEVDRVEIDRNVNFKKYYVFRSQFDVQIFSDLTFIENNGRGGLAYGICRLISP